MPTITTSTTVSRRDGLLANELSGDEAVMLDVDRGMYFGVRDVAKAIWDRIEEPVRVGEVCADLIAQFEVEPAQCEREVTAFLVELHRHGLVEVHA